MLERFVGSVVTVILVAWAPAAAGQGDALEFEIGPRSMLVTAGGEPANDMMAVGVYGRYRLQRQWWIGFAVDSLGGDFERPYALVGLTAPEEIDSSVDAVVLSAWIERTYGGQDGKLGWFWSAGLGFASPDVDDVSGSTSAGGTFDITTDAGSETLLSLAGGLRRTLGGRWHLEAGLRVDHHFADWRIADRVSGATGSVDDYTARGVHVGVTYRF